jgi:hypothetical protein
VLQDDGWDAVWVKNFGGGRKFWIDMDVTAVLHPAASRTLRGIDAAMEKLMSLPEASEAERLKRGGVWDLFAIKEGETLFIEDKFAPGLNANQKLFLEAALNEAKPPTFLVLNRIERLPEPPK